MLNFIHHASHGGDKVVEGNQNSEQMLDKLEKEYPTVFNESTYPLWEHRQPFQIPLIDTSKQLAHHHLYPLSGEELTELKKQINEWLGLGFVVPLACPYGHLVLFAENKGGGSLCLYVDYPTLNANTMTDILAIDMY